jgi:hypothetical protein
MNTFDGKLHCERAFARGLHKNGEVADFSHGALTAE